MEATFHSKLGEGGGAVIRDYRAGWHKSSSSFLILRLLCATLTGESALTGQNLLQGLQGSNL